MTVFHFNECAYVRRHRAPPSGSRIWGFKITGRAEVWIGPGEYPEAARDARRFAEAAEPPAWPPALVEIEVLP